LSPEKLKIATWNCNGALRHKWPLAEALAADLLVVQECEDPSQSKDEAYRAWASNYQWVGASKNKGLGVFARQGLSLELAPLKVAPLELFLPIMVGQNGFEWSLLATWTKRANSPTFGYIGQLWKFLQSHKAFLVHPAALLLGDLNSNSKWDVWDRWWNHSDVVKELEALGLRSLYHAHFDELQGCETRPTFCMYRNQDRPFHIDYAFAGPHWDLGKVEVGQVESWLPHSDHMPLMAELVIRR
jgi:exonuclease III